MKKLLTGLCLVLTGLAADARTNLIRLKPVEENRYKVYDNVGKKYNVMHLSTFAYDTGFTLDTGKGGLIAEENPGYVVFDLGGKYDRLSFIAGSAEMVGQNAGNALNGDVIFTVTADGNRLVDDVVRITDVPKEYVLDVKGVHKIRFALPRGEQDMTFAEAMLWQEGETVKFPSRPATPEGTVNLITELGPYWHVDFFPSSSFSNSPVIGREQDNLKSINVTAQTFNSGLSFRAEQQLIGGDYDWCFFWLQKQYDKISFIVGPRDNQSSAADAWIVVKGDGKILYETLVKQSDMARRVVVDVKGVDVLSFHSEYNSSMFLGGLTVGLVEMYAYSPGEKVPEPGIVSVSAAKLKALPDVCRLVSNIKPYSVRGVGKKNDTFFTGESDHYTFSMGGEKFSEGFVLTTGNTFFDDNITSYASFDLGGEFDWISFKAGTLSKHRVLDDDKIQVYADDRLVLETTIYATWPNQYFEIPVYKCHKLTFAKPGTNKSKQTYFGIADVTLYRGKPVPNNLFVHRKPECPEEADLIDLCGKPYFHFVGRYESDLTNFSYDDCFKPGGSMRDYFQMKDGSKVYKGFMLETNIPLALENVTMSQALFMFLTGIGGVVGSSAVSAAMGVANTGGLVGGISTIALVADGGKQSSAAAFNPYGEYESCTFTVANKSEYLDPVSDIIGGEKQAPPVKLYVFADQHLVGEIMLNDKMSPTTFTVPIRKCTQLMFWLNCGDVRSGQYVFYDLTVSKKAYTGEDIVRNFGSSPKVEQDDSQSVTTRKGGRKKKAAKQDKPIVWDLERYSSDSDINAYLKDAEKSIKEVNDLRERAQLPYSVKQTWVEASDGTVFKCVSFVDRKGNRIAVSVLQQKINEIIVEAKTLQNNITIAKIGAASASLGVPLLPSFSDMAYFGKYVKLAGNVLSQSGKNAAAIQKDKEEELDDIKAIVNQALDVTVGPSGMASKSKGNFRNVDAYDSASGTFRSTEKVLILLPEKGDEIPQVRQRLEYFDF